MPVERASKFSLRGSAFFFTWPQSGVTTKEVVEEGLKKLFGDKMQWYCVGKELHADGSPHLHACIQLMPGKRVQFSGLLGMGRLDAITGKHGNYQSPRSIFDVMKYVVKGGDFLQVGIDVELALSAHKQKTTTVVAQFADAIRTGAVLKDVECLNPGFFMMQMKKISDYRIWTIGCLKATQALTGMVEASPKDDKDWNNQIASWIRENLLRERVHRQPQLWIKSPTGCGKTFLVMLLESMGLRIYHWPYEEWNDAYQDDQYDLIVMDEFGGKRCVYPPFLNALLEGKPEPLKRRGLPPVLKRKNLPILILSNFEPHEVYEKYVGQDYAKLNPLMSRLTVVEADGPIRIIMSVADCSDEEISSEISESDIDSLSDTLEYHSVFDPVENDSEPEKMSTSE